MACYGQRFTCEESYKDQKNDPCAGFHLDGVEVGSAGRWDRLWLIFAWAYYWLNVGGWAMEQQGYARHWRANASDRRTHALWRLGHWGLEPHDIVWRTLVRWQRRFQTQIPPIGEVAAPT